MQIVRHTDFSRLERAPLQQHCRHTHTHTKCTIGINKNTLFCKIEVGLFRFCFRFLFVFVFFVFVFFVFVFGSFFSIQISNIPCSHCCCSVFFSLGFVGFELCGNIRPPMCRYCSLMLHYLSKQFSSLDSRMPNFSTRNSIVHVFISLLKQLASVH